MSPLDGRVLTQQTIQFFFSLRKAVKWPGASVIKVLVDVFFLRQDSPFIVLCGCLHIRAIPQQFRSGIASVLQARAHPCHAKSRTVVH